MITIDPRYLNAPTWASKTTGALLPYGVIPILLDENKWRQWADYVILIPDIAALGPPRPEIFSDWRLWALAFNQTLALVET